MALLGYRTGTDGTQPLTANGSIPVGALFTNTAAGTAYNTSTTPTNIEPALAPVTGFTAASGTGVIPGGHLNTVGKVFRVKAGGTFGVTGTPTFKLDILLGSTVIATTGAQTGAAAASMSFNFECTCVVTGIGASGTVLSTGFFQYYTTAPVAVHWRVTNTTAGTADTVDLTVDKAFHLQGTWNTSNASNTITVAYCTFEFLN